MVDWNVIKWKLIIGCYAFMIGTVLTIFLPIPICIIIFILIGYGLVNIAEKIGFLDLISRCLNVYGEYAFWVFIIIFCVPCGIIGFFVGVILLVPYLIIFFCGLPYLIVIFGEILYLLFMDKLGKDIQAKSDTYKNEAVVSVFID